MAQGLMMKIAGGLLFAMTLYAAVQSYRLQSCQTQLEKERKEWALANVKARQDALNALVQMNKNYQAVLEERNRQMAQISQAYNKALVDIMEGVKKDAEFKRWADEPLPAVVVNRLQHLQAERTAAGD